MATDCWFCRHGLPHHRHAIAPPEGFRELIRFAGDADPKLALRRPSSHAPLVVVIPESERLKQRLCDLCCNGFTPTGAKNVVCPQCRSNVMRAAAVKRHSRERQQRDAQ